jgi:hypothetical protein
MMSVLTRLARVLVSTRMFPTKRTIGFAVAAALLALGGTAAPSGLERTPHANVASRSVRAVADWSLEAQRAIVPPPAGVGNKFPGEAAVYMGIVHAAMYDAAVAIEGGFHPYAIALNAPANTSRAAVIAAAAHGVLVGFCPPNRPIWITGMRTISLRSLS